jgi:hypothetical protein
MRGPFTWEGKRFRAAILLALLCDFLTATGCTGVSLNKPPGAFLGRAQAYDYSPAAIQIGNLQQFWWCGEAHNPALQSQVTDSILYASVDVTTQVSSVPVVVLSETPGAWDSAYTCNPKVIGGVFNNPLGDGVTYTYAMYYAGTSSPIGIANSIGVAFSNDGVHWNKYPQPVIMSPTQGFYGVGQPAVYNSDHKSGIWLFYEDLEGPAPPQHYEATSTDGVHFSLQGQITKNGQQNDPLDGTWGDMAYDSAAGYWYGAFNMPLRNPSVTGGVQERGQLGVALYRIPQDSLLTGASAWQRLASFDTNLTGHEANFIAAFLRDQYGNVNVGPYPTIQLYTSMSNPVPPWNASPAEAGLSGGIANWDIGSVQWVPANSKVPLMSYSNGTSTEVTTGYIDPSAGFKLGSTLAHVFQGPQSGANVALYGCKSGATSYFVTTDSTCGGSLLLGVTGYLYSAPQSGVSLVPLYNCSNAAAAYVSNNATCQGAGASTNTSAGPASAAGALLGYALP